MIEKINDNRKHGDSKNYIYVIGMINYSLIYTLSVKRIYPRKQNLKIETPVNCSFTGLWER